MESLNLSGLNVVDIVILAIIFFSIIMGFARGFISETISLLTWIAAFVVGIAFTNPLANYFNGTAVVQSAVSNTTSAIGTSTATPVSYMTIAVSFAILFITTLIIGGIVKMILNAIFTRGFLGFGNRLMGGVFGFARGYLFALALVFLVQLSPLATKSWWTESKAVPYFQPQIAQLGALVSPALANLKATFGSGLDNVKDTVQGVTDQIKQ